MVDHNASTSYRYVSICSFLSLLIFFQYIQGPPISCENYDAEWMPDLKVDKKPQREEHDINHRSDITHWCVLEPKMIRRNSMLNFGQNIAHTAESLLPCWSMLYELGVTHNCGIDTTRLRLRPIRGWTEQLVRDAMKCKIRNETVYPGQNDLIHKPNLYLMQPYYKHIQYLSSPDHAKQLRKHLVSDEYIAERKGPGMPLQIGIVNRLKNRHIINVNELAEGLQRAITYANVSVTYFDHGPPIQEQAEWWASHDVIIAAHGAGIVNSIFITQRTIVLQLYPPGWYWPTMEPLVLQSGGIPLDWFDHHQKLNQDEISSNLKVVAKDGNTQNFSVPVEDIVNRVEIALGRKEANFDKLTSLLGAKHTYH